MVDMHKTIRFQVEFQKRNGEPVEGKTWVVMRAQEYHEQSRLSLHEWIRRSYSTRFQLPLAYMVVPRIIINEIPIHDSDLQSVPFTTLRDEDRIVIVISQFDVVPEEVEQID